VLREHEAGAKTEEVCRRHGISHATFYKWKAKYGGLDVSEARRLKSLEDDNRRLKKLLAEAMLDNAGLRNLLKKTGDACGAAGGRRAAHRSVSHEPGARMQAGGTQSVQSELQAPTTR